MIPTTISREKPDSIAVESPLDAISLSTAFWRSLRPLRVISNSSLRGPFTQRQFVDAVTTVQRQAAADASIQKKSFALWQMERLSFSYCRHGQNSLDDQAIPVEAQPISHVGLGIAATESAEFASEKIIELIEARAHPEYRLYPYESIGCIWAAYASKPFQLVFRFVSRTKIQPRKLPNWSEFLDHFSAVQQHLISHGYGRTLYFRKLNIGRAISAAIRLDGLDTTWAVKGIAFAYAMINHADLNHVLEVGSDLREPLIADAFRSGLINALVFWELAFPGFLEGMMPSSERQAKMVTCAEGMIEEGRRSGQFSVFGVA